MTDIIQADPKHVAFMNALRAAQRAHDAKLSTSDMLGIASQFVGTLIAQMPAGVTPESVMETITENIAFGNSQMVLALLAAIPKDQPN